MAVPLDALKAEFCSALAPPAPIRIPDLLVASTHTVELLTVTRAMESGLVSEQVGALDVSAVDT